jgi:hypothetical protein
MIPFVLPVISVLSLVAGTTPVTAPAPTPALTATKSADLQFGTFTVGPAGGSVIMDPLGTSHCVGNLQATAAFTSPAIFTLTGPPLSMILWNVAPNPVRLGPGNGPTVFNFQAANRTGALIFDAKGQAQLEIGASMAVPALCPAGNYRTTQLVLTLSVPGSTAHCLATFAVMAGLMTPLSIQETSSLNFGTITPQAKAFTVSITPAGMRSLAGGGIFSTGAFSVSGQPGALVSLSLPVSGIALKGPGVAMQLTNFTTDLPGTFNLSAGGQVNFHVGGSLLVNANQAKGQYSGQYPVTVNYLF